MEDIFARGKYSQAEREKMDASDFAGPHSSFPIRDQEDVDNAARLIGHADDPEAVKQNIIKIAKRKGLQLPKSWQEEEDSGRGSEEERMAGKPVVEQPTNFSFYVPFTRISPDDERREIVGVATKEVLDTHGTIISYEGSKKAFARWAGNIREQHDPKKAVGKAIEWWADDENRQIFVRAYISKGAEDTWQKIKEGVLTGFSVSGTEAKYKTIQRDSKTIPVIDEYTMPELSIVDNPSCPVGPVVLVRADGMAAETLATDEEVSALLQKAQPAPDVAPIEAQPATIERAGARISADTQGALHAARNGAIASAKTLMDTCGCDQCQSGSNALDPDGDGDIDWMSLDDTDGDAGRLTDEAADDTMERVERMMGAVYSRMHAYLGEFARRQTDTQTLHSAIERIAGSLATVANKAEVDAKIDKVLSELETVKGLFERIAKTPVPGGPHTGRTAQKHLATDGSSAEPPSQDTPDVLRDLARAGVELTPGQSARLVAASLTRTTIH